VEFCGTRKDVLEIRGSGVDLFGSHQALDQDPTVVSPCFDFGVARES
jgi:hypothetical protein